MPAWVGSESKWEKAKKLARKQYPKAKGARFWKLTAGIYKQMGGAMKKAGISMIELQKALPGSSHQSHRYLQRTGGPGKWKYEYEAGKQPGKKSAASLSEETSNQHANPNSDDASGDSPGFPDKADTSAKNPVKLKLDIGNSILRDAQPEDLEEDSIVLWRAIDQPSIDAMRQQGKLVGEDPDNGTTLSGTRVGALAQAAEDKTPHEDALIAVNIKTDSLEPVPPATTVEECLFPENPGMSAVHVAGHIPGNAVVGVVQPGDKLWPSEEEETAGNAPEPDQDDQEPQEDPEVALQRSLGAIYLKRRV